MISFYDWAPTPDGTASKTRDIADDSEAQRNPEVQGQICQKIQDAVDISDVFNKIAINAGKASPKTLVYAAHRIARYCRLRKQDIGPTRRAARFLSLLSEILKGLSTLEAQALTDLSWSLAVLNHRDNRVLAAICHEVFRRVEEFSPPNLAISAWSFATVSYRDDLVMKRINRQALGRLPEFEAQSIANLAWALATMRFKDDVLMHHIAGEALRKIDRFSAQHVANMAWAYATLGRRGNALFESLEKRALVLLRDETDDFVPLDLALCSWSFAWLEHAGPDSALLRGIAAGALTRLREFSTQQMANMLWGFDHANFIDPGFYKTIAHWCCTQPMSFWQRAAGEELVSIMTAVKPYAAGQQGWRELEAFFIKETLQPMADFLREANTSDGYSQGLRKLRTYHAGALYTAWLFTEIGITHLGDGDDPRVARKVEDLIEFYLLPPEPRWLPDGYDDDDVQANRAEIPCLLEMLDVKRRVQPSSHFIALHLAAELLMTVPGMNGSEEGSVLRRNIWRVVPTRPPRRAGLCFVRGVKFEEHGMPDDDNPGHGMRTATLRDYQRTHHAEVTALSQVAEAIAEMEERISDSLSSTRAAMETSSPDVPSKVRGWVELFVPHYPCSSCTGALVQFAKMYPLLEVRVGHDDWRHWLRRLRQRWDPKDTRQHNLSVNARQLRDLDENVGEAIPENYRAALKATLGTSGIAGDVPPPSLSRGGYGMESTQPENEKQSSLVDVKSTQRQSFY